jgi:hypothetical protein
MLLECLHLSIWTRSRKSRVTPIHLSRRVSSPFLPVKQVLCPVTKLQKHTYRLMEIKSQSLRRFEVRLLSTKLNLSNKQTNG